MKNDPARRVRDSQRQERRGAVLHGGKRRPGSGAPWSAKGDVRTDDTLLEYKRTNGSRITITAVMLSKIRTEALSEGRRPLLGFEVAGRDYIIMEASDYEADQEELRGRQGAS